jgi:alkaline phosphatase D
MRLLSQCFCLAISLLIPQLASAEESFKLAFGSCNRANRSQDIWPVIAAKDPAAFLFIGDNVYADTTDEAQMKASYDQLSNQPEFKNFRAKVPVFATWDDHDFGANDAGAEFPAKDMAQRLFLDFTGQPKDSPRRQQKGIYSAERMQWNGMDIQLILLDTRYHRSPLLRKNRGYIANFDPNATLLGKEQWLWLEERLKEPADLRILASSIQVLSGEHRYEKWANFPLEQQKLFDLIRQTKANGLLMISGDRHLGDQSVLNDSRVPYPLYDFTSSGMTEQLEDTISSEKNSLRVENTFAHTATNFGLIELHRANPKSPWKVTMRLMDGTGRSMETVSLELDQLQVSQAKIK